MAAMAMKTTSSWERWTRRALSWPRHFHRNRLGQHLRCLLQPHAGSQGTLHLLDTRVIRPIIAADRDETSPARVQDISFETKLAHRVGKIMSVLCARLEHFTRAAPPQILEDAQDLALSRNGLNGMHPLIRGHDKSPGFLALEQAESLVRVELFEK